MRASTAVVSIAVAACSTCAADPIERDAFVALHRPEPTAVIQYGAQPSQAIDVFTPSGHGPHPVAILIHGGCWRNLPGAGREQLRHIGAELATRGVAVWSIGYRRADEDGGGYPGTFQDVADAVDRLRLEAQRFALDLSRTVVVGHSAGGHLALWAAARDGLPKHAPLHRPHAFMPGAVISLAGIPDLRAMAPLVPLLCGPGIIERLTANGSTDVYRQISPVELPAPPMKVTMISGVLDRLIPPYVAADFARKRRAPVEILHIPGAGHFDLVTPGAAAWSVVSSSIVRALQ